MNKILTFLFNKRPRILWRSFRLLDPETLMFFTLREHPETKEKEILHQGPMGDNKWHPVSEVSGKWEKEALARSVPWSGCVYELAKIKDNYNRK